jgi:hypothetical protein
MKTIHAYTNAHHPLPGYLNLSQDEKANIVLSVRQNGEDLPKTITLSIDDLKDLVNSASVFLNEVSPKRETVEAERGIFGSHFHIDEAPFIPFEVPKEN